VNKPIRCTTHFHACDCREYEFEQLKLSNEAIKERNLELVELISNMNAKFAEKDAKIEKLKREKSTAIKSLDRVNKLLSNGEHLNSSWIKDIIETQSSNIDEEMRLKGVVLKLQKENQEMREALNQAVKILEEGCLVYDQHVPSGSSSFRVEADMFIKDVSKCYNLSETPNSSKEGVE